MQVVWGSGGIAPPFLTSSLYGSELSSSCSVHFAPVERTPGTDLVGGWVGPRSGLDPVKFRNILSFPGIEPRSTSPYPVAIPTELRWFLNKNHVSIITTALLSFLTIRALTNSFRESFLPEFDHCQAIYTFSAIQW
jgi:hypothetical protein